MSPASIEASPVLSLAFAAAIFGIMLSVASILLRLASVGNAVTAGKNRYGSLDGLRGVLAVGVLIHHSVTAYLYFTTGVWKWGGNPILNQLGQSTVALFFMITAFLFALKVESANLDWRAFYSARLARLFPLYALIVTLVFAIALMLTGGELHESLSHILKAFFVWITFLVFQQSAPDVNGYRMTWTLIAGVNWSLRYEIFFYLFAVPVLYICARLFTIRLRFAIAFCLMAALLALRQHNNSGSGNLLYASQFLGGIIVAYGSKFEKLRLMMSHTWLRILAAMAVVFLSALTFSYSCLAIICTMLILASVVGGATVHNTLSNRAAIWLGDISYGIYLLHGLTLWTTMFILKKFLDLPNIGLLAFFSVIAVDSIIVVLIASLSYVLLERPVMLAAHSRERRRSVT